MAINLIVANIGAEEPNLDNEWLLQYVGFHKDVEGKIINGVPEFARLNDKSVLYKMYHVRIRDEQIDIPDLIIIVTKGSPPNPDDDFAWATQNGPKEVFEAILRDIFTHLPAELLEHSENLYAKGMMAIVVPDAAKAMEAIAHKARQSMIRAVVEKRDFEGDCRTIVKEGVVAELHGKYWGIQYNDGQVTEYGFGPIEKAHVADPEFCKKPEDMTHKSHPRRGELAQATLRPIQIRTIYDVKP